MAERGRFLVLEGIDGCGKTTQIERLQRWLPCSGLMPPQAQLLVTREPGGTELGRALRQLLLHPPGGAAPGSTAELLLYAADRAQHVQQHIAPALAAGHWVLCDRFTGSTAAYQGYGRGLSLDLIAELAAMATGGLQADLTVLLEIPLAESLCRRHHRPADRIEASGEAFLARVCAGFSALAAEGGWTRVDGQQDVDQVADAIQRAVQDLWGGRADG